MCDACSRNTWKKVKCWIHCSLSCIQLLSWPVHRWFRGNYTGHIYVLHFFTMKVVWVDPAKKKNTLVSPTRWMDRLPIWFYQEFLPSSADLVTSIFGDVHPLSHLSFAVETIFTCWIKSHVSQWNLRGSSWKVVVHLGNHLKLLQFSHFSHFFIFFPIFSGWNAPNPPLFVGCPMGFWFLPGLLRSHRGERGGRLDLVRLLGCRWGSPGELRGFSAVEPWENPIDSQVFYHMETKETYGNFTC